MILVVATALLTFLKQNVAFLPNAVNTQMKLFIYVKTEPHRGILRPRCDWKWTSGFLHHFLTADCHRKGPALLSGTVALWVRTYLTAGPGNAKAMATGKPGEELQSWHGQGTWSLPPTLIFLRRKLRASRNNSEMPQDSRECGIYL